MVELMDFYRKATTKYGSNFPKTHNVGESLGAPDGSGVVGVSDGINVVGDSDGIAVGVIDGVLSDLRSSQYFCQKQKHTELERLDNHHHHN